MPAPGENTIVMFKSCFPNSDVGSDISDELAVYKSLLPYFEAASRQDVRARDPAAHDPKHLRCRQRPGSSATGSPTATRAGSPVSTGGNVFVFDLYNVLTHPGAHHRLVDGTEVHETVPGSDTLYYDSDGDDHPNTEGNVKATEEFMGSSTRGTRPSPHA